MGRKNLDQQISLARDELKAASVAYDKIAHTWHAQTAAGDVLRKAENAAQKKLDRLMARREAMPNPFPEDDSVFARTADDASRDTNMGDRQRKALIKGAARRQRGLRFGADLGYHDRVGRSPHNAWATLDATKNPDGGFPSIPPPTPKSTNATMDYLGKARVWAWRGDDSNATSAARLPPGHVYVKEPGYLASYVEVKYVKLDVQNPSSGEREAAVDKYKEFHRYEPTAIGDFPGDFEIPQEMLRGGKAHWVTYRSAKVDPSTLKKPRKPVDYIHEHDAGVEVYLPDDPYSDLGDLDHDELVQVPEEFANAQALVLLGENLGFSFDLQGEKIEAVGDGDLPELYCTPCGKCLLVIQDKREVLAMMWGGALGVFARGIDG